MKQCILLVLMAFYAAGVCAQKIRFTDSSNKWKLLYLTDDPYATIEDSWYGRDTLIAGLKYRRLYATQRGIAVGLAIREDTAQEKLYFRFMGQNADTSEQLFFDYQLKPGDTLKIKNGSSQYKYVVQTRDSVQLGGVYHRRWTMQPSGFIPFQFIEGLGTNHYPLQLVYPANGLSGYQLRCFTNRGVHPVCKPAIPLPYGTYLPHFDREPYGIVAFDNDTSCTIRRYSPTAVDALTLKQPGNIFPNPGGGNMVLLLPAATTRIFLRVSDVYGRTVLTQSLRAGSAAFPIGQYVTVPGVYTYLLQDVATGKRYSGRFVRQ